MNSYITIDGWKSNIRFSSAHIIHEYEKCGRLHGHTYAIHVKVFGKPDKKGIIVDFSILKEKLRIISNELDHRLLIPEKSKAVEIIKDQQIVKINAPDKTFILPICDCRFLPIETTSAENLSIYILDRLIEELKFDKNIDSIEIGVDEGYGQGARNSLELKKK